MTPDDLRIAVRPRSILECLDLACMFCVRRCPGIAVALLVGALPMALINVVLIGPDGADRLLPSWFFWLALETPWAMAPLTLFLGVAMFTDRLGAADWRGIAGGMAGAVGPLLIYQTLLRGLSILFVLPFPFLLVALAFVDPVILLERGPIRGIWRRSIAIFARSRGRILAALALEMVIVPLGWVLAVFAIDQLASLWAGRPVMAVLDPDRPDWALGRALFTWRGQLAWWGVMTLVTVFRFVTYIDTRIRDEGWDIELKLRNPATYVGLERWRGAAAVIVIVALLMAPAAAVGAEEEGEATAQAAQKAVVKQRFPWYDAGSDGFRPVVGRSMETGTRRSEFEFGALGTVAKGGMIVLLIAAVAAVAWVVRRHGFDPVVKEEIESPAAAAVFGDEHLETLPEQARADIDNLLPLIEARLAAGDHAAAAILYHAWQLVELHRGGVIELAPGKTNRRYAADVAARAPLLADLFRHTARLSERARFGRLPVSAEAFDEVWNQRDRIHSAATEAAA
jgi:Domain of unknown function (DUF4129)